MVKKIFTHKGLAHFDEFLACSLLLVLYPDATIYRINPSDIKAKEIEDDAIYVDIGEKLTNKIIDHHQDLELPSSFALVLKRFFNIDIHSDPDLFFDYIYYDIKDRYGPQKANSICNVNIPFENPITISILNMFSQQTKINKETMLHNFMKSLGEEILKDVNKRLIIKQKIQSLQKIETNKGIIVYEPNQTVEIFWASKLIPNLIGVIHKSPQDGNVAIVRINESPHFKPTNILHIIPNPVFIHKTGFIVVIKPEDLANLTIEQLIKNLSQENSPIKKLSSEFSKKLSNKTF